VKVAFRDGFVHIRPAAGKRVFVVVAAAVVRAELPNGATEL
jgi:hypothetical protein